MFAKGILAFANPFIPILAAWFSLCLHSPLPSYFLFLPASSNGTGPSSPFWGSSTAARPGSCTASFWFDSRFHYHAHICLFVSVLWRESQWITSATKKFHKSYQIFLSMYEIRIPNVIGWTKMNISPILKSPMFCCFLSPFWNSPFFLCLKHSTTGSASLDNIPPYISGVLQFYWPSVVSFERFFWLSWNPKQNTQSDCRSR